MSVDWEQKWMSVPHGDSEVVLQGIIHSVDHCKEISSKKLSNLEELQAVWYCFLLNPLQ